MWRVTLLAFVTLACTSATDAAQICDRRGGYHLSSDGNYPMFIRTRAGSTCEATFSNVSGSDLTFKRLFLVTPPAQGKINLREGGYYVYSAPSGYRGADTFTLKVCGTENNKPGCATLNYSVTIE
jgi:Big-like domain-containing protein